MGQDGERELVIVGAGPYGLSIAAQLISAGLEPTVLGRPLELWREHMPRGMNLRSLLPWSSLADGAGRFTLPRFLQQSTDHCVRFPIPLQTFVDYGMWFQRNAVPVVDQRYLTCLQRDGKRFRLTLDDGKELRAGTVVLAAGLLYYANRPAEFRQLPPARLSHSFDHPDLGRFAGQTVAVVGGGQSAMESAALLSEAGASVHLVSRRSIVWLKPDDMPEHTLAARVWRHLSAPPNSIAPGWVNWTLSHFPYLLHAVPEPLRFRFVLSRHDPSASHWLRERVRRIRLHERETIRRIRDTEGGVELGLSSGETIRADHVLTATGYQVDLARLPMLHPSLLSQIRRLNGAPELDANFESSVPGLYFVGLSSVPQFGPLFRFVAGTPATARQVSRAIAGAA